MVPYQSENGKYNQISVNLLTIRDKFLCTIDWNICGKELEGKVTRTVLINEITHTKTIWQQTKLMLSAPKAFISEWNDPYFFHSPQFFLYLTSGDGSRRKIKKIRGGVPLKI